MAIGREGVLRGSFRQKRRYVDLALGRELFRFSPAQARELARRLSDASLSVLKLPGDGSVTIEFIRPNPNDGSVGG